MLRDVRKGGEDVSLWHAIGSVVCGMCLTCHYGDCDGKYEKRLVVLTESQHRLWSYSILAASLVSLGVRCID